MTRTRSRFGFARGTATYKRIGLLTHDPGRTLALLAGPRPVQFVLAGKAHPSDEEAKRVVQEMFRFKDAPHVAEHVVYLHDYDVEVGARFVRGCDLWLNLPRPPLEANGTSGMKAVINGGLNMSTLDGWWAEAYDETNGWALSGEVDPDHGAQDARDAATLFATLEQEVLPAFYDRDPDGLPDSCWPGYARRCARWVPPSAPGECSRTTCSGSTRRRPSTPEPTDAEDRPLGRGAHRSIRPADPGIEPAIGRAAVQCDASSRSAWSQCAK